MKLNIFKILRIKYLCRKYGVNINTDNRSINTITINDDYTINVEGNVRIDPYKKTLRKLPLKFKYVSGSFNCDGLGLTTLKGSPERSFSFSCARNHLTSLRYGPKYTYSYNFNTNNILTLEHIPTSVSVIDSQYNPIEYIYKTFNTPSKIELFNDYDIVQDDKIIWTRLEDFLIEIKWPRISLKGFCNHCYNINHNRRLSMIDHTDYYGTFNQCYPSFQTINHPRNNRQYNDPQIFDLIRELDLPYEIIFD